MHAFKRRRAGTFCSDGWIYERREWPTLRHGQVHGFVADRHRRNHNGDRHRHPQLTRLRDHQCVGSVLAKRGPTGIQSARTCTDFTMKFQYLLEVLSLTPQLSPDRLGRASSVPIGTRPEYTVWGLLPRVMTSL